MQNYDHNIVFFRKTANILPKIVKNRRNCDHNIDPWYIQTKMWKKIPK
jgi:hypothetical protein